MEKGSNFGFYQHPPNLDLLDFPFDTGSEHVFMNPQCIEDSTLKTASFFPVSDLQQYRTNEQCDSQNRSKCMPRVTLLNTASEERFPSDPFVFGRQRTPAVVAAPACKRFLVFDQTGDRTTLVYNSGFQIPVHFGASSVLNPSTTRNLNKEEPRDGLYPLTPVSPNENVDDTLRDAKEDEMHEDTEELNALLYSDSDTDYSVDDEETSTGHSPSTMTEHGGLDLVEETGEEVDSFSVPAKRQKILTGGYDTTLGDSGGASLNLEDEDEAESYCGSKRSRKEKICETLSILQSIIPNAYGEDAISVIDGAIHHLRLLKAKSAALGLNTL